MLDPGPKAVLVTYWWRDSCHPESHVTVTLYGRVPVTATSHASYCVAWAALHSSASFWPVWHSSLPRGLALCLSTACKMPCGLEAQSEWRHYPMKEGWDTGTLQMTPLLFLEGCGHCRTDKPEEGQEVEWL